MSESLRNNANKESGRESELRANTCAVFPMLRGMYLQRKLFQTRSPKTPFPELMLKLKTSTLARRHDSHRGRLPPAHAKKQ